MSDWADAPAVDPVGLCLKLRHGPQLIPCRLAWISGPAIPTKLGVHLSRADRGIAAGQFAVFYLGEECLGSGKICEDDDGQHDEFWQRHQAELARQAALEQAELAAKKKAKQARRARFGSRSEAGE